MNKKVIKTAIIISWVLLGVCIIFKLCGSNVFELAITNNHFLAVCNWLDTDGIYFSYALSFVMSIVSTTFILMAASLIYKPTWKQLLFIEAVNIPVWFVKIFFPKVGFIIECVMFIVVPAVISRKWWTGFLGLALNVVFQLASMFIKGQEVKIFDSNTIFSLIFTIDYYIMIALYYLYVVMIKKSKKEDKPWDVGVHSGCQKTSHNSKTSKRL